jgi:hypothetical protein
MSFVISLELLTVGHARFEGQGAAAVHFLDVLARHAILVPWLPGCDPSRRCCISASDEAS